MTKWAVVRTYQRRELAAISPLGVLRKKLSTPILIEQRIDYFAEGVVQIGISLAQAGQAFDLMFETASCIRHALYLNAKSLFPDFMRYRIGKQEWHINLSNLRQPAKCVWKIITHHRLRCGVNTQLG